MNTIGAFPHCYSICRQCSKPAFLRTASVSMGIPRNHRQGTGLLNTTHVQSLEQPTMNYGICLISTNGILIECDIYTYIYNHITIKQQLLIQSRIHI